MGDYFSNLAARTMGLALPIEPRPVSRFEPNSPADFFDRSELFAAEPGEENLASERAAQDSPSTINSTPRKELSRAIIPSNDSASRESDDHSPAAATQEISPPKRNPEPRFDFSSQMYAPRQRSTAVMSQVGEQPAESANALEMTEREPASNRKTVGDISEAPLPLLNHSSDRGISKRDSMGDAAPSATAKRDVAFTAQPTKADAPLRRSPHGSNDILERAAPISVRPEKASRVESKFRSTPPASEGASPLKANRIQTNVVVPASDRPKLARETPGAQTPVRPERITRAIEAALATRSEPASPRLSQADGDSSPTVQITIGRVEVKAITPPVARPLAVALPKPSMSLDDYLRKRSGGVK